MRFAKVILFCFVLFFALPTFAMPPKGFHEGPYLRLIGGVNSSTFDKNARTGQKTGNDYEGTFGAEFGWNIWDSAGPEIQLRYVTKKVRNTREHVVNINLNLKYNFVTNALTDLAGGKLHILPFVQGGPAALIAAVPGDPAAAGDDVMAVWGVGGGLGVGSDFLILKYLYLGFIVQVDVHYIPSVKQNINGVKQTIIAGGWEPQLGVLGMAGVHF